MPPPHDTESGPTSSPSHLPPSPSPGPALSALPDFHLLSLQIGFTVWEMCLPDPRPALLTPCSLPGPSWGRSLN